MFGNNKIRTDDVDVILKQHERLYFILSFIIALIANVLSYLFLRFTVGSLMDLFVELDAKDLLVAVFLLVPSIVIEIVAVMSLFRLVRQHVKITKGEYEIMVATVSDRLGDFLQSTMTLYDEDGRLTEVESSFLINKKIRNESKILYAVIEGEKNRVIIPNCRAVMLSKGRANIVDLDEPSDEIQAFVRESMSRKWKRYRIADIAFILSVVVVTMIEFIASRTEHPFTGSLVAIFELTCSIILLAYIVAKLDCKIDDNGDYKIKRIIPFVIIGLTLTVVTTINFHVLYVTILAFLWIASYLFYRIPAIREKNDILHGRYKVSEGSVLGNEARMISRHWSSSYTNIKKISPGILTNRVYLMDGTVHSGHSGDGHYEFSYKVRAENSVIYDIRTNVSGLNAHPIGYVGLLIVRYDPYLQEDEAILL